jgi:hypothetical protein
MHNYVTLLHYEVCNLCHQYRLCIYIYIIRRQQDVYLTKLGFVQPTVYFLVR